MGVMADSDEGGGVLRVFYPAGAQSDKIAFLLMETPVSGHKNLPSVIYMAPNRLNVA
jgi:hypothetical protein